MRYSFIQELTKHANDNKDIILLTGDLGFTVFENFRDQFSNQFLNVGVSESNMISLASGLAKSNKKVFAYSIATFASMRPFEQIRNDVCYPNLPVVIVGSGAGLSYSDAGPSHYAIEDISLLRALPNIEIICPSDPIETKSATKYAIKATHPIYLRLGKHGEQNIHESSFSITSTPYDYIKQGDKILIFSTGNIVNNSLEASNNLIKKGFNPSLICLHSFRISSAYYKELINIIKKYRYVFTIEEHTIIGGLGSLIAEIISENNVNTTLTRIGIRDSRIEKYGNQNFLRNKYNLTPQKISKTIIDKINS